MPLTPVQPWSSLGCCSGCCLTLDDEPGWGFSWGTGRPGAPGTWMGTNYIFIFPNFCQKFSIFPNDKHRQQTTNVLGVPATSSPVQIIERSSYCITVTKILKYCGHHFFEILVSIGPALDLIHECICKVLYILYHNLVLKIR